MKWGQITKAGVSGDKARAAELALAGRLPPQRWAPELRVLFENSLAGQQFEANRFVLWLALAVTILSPVIDYLTIPEHLGFMMTARLALVLPLQIVGLLLPRRLLVWQKLVTGMSIVNFGALLLAGAQWASPVTGAYMAMGPILMLGIVTPMLPYPPREIRMFLIVYASAMAIVALLSESETLVNPALVGIAGFTFALCLIVPQRLWALRGRNFLFDLQFERRMGELGETNSKLAAMSREDPLTGLANRRHADETFARLYAASPAFGEARPAVIMLDLDRFKAFNDSWGHQTGDECLRAVAEEMRYCAARHGGLAARFGGEEFVILFRALDAREALATAEDLRRAIELIEIAHTEGRTTATCTASIGVALHKEEGRPDLGDLLSRADAALYAAKRAGRNRTVLAD